MYSNWNVAFHLKRLSSVVSPTHISQEIHVRVHVHTVYHRLWLLSVCAYNARLQSTMRLTKRGVPIQAHIHAHF